MSVFDKGNLNAGPYLGQCGPVPNVLGPCQATPPSLSSSQWHSDGIWRPGQEISTSATLHFIKIVTSKKRSSATRQGPLFRGTCGTCLNAPLFEYDLFLFHRHCQLRNHLCLDQPLQTFQSWRCCFIQVLLFSVSFRVES